MTDGNYLSDEKILVELANYRMPYGRFANKLLMDIPEEYYIWFRNKGFPEGKLGNLMSTMLEIKTNGLERILLPFRKAKF